MARDLDYNKNRYRTELVSENVVFAKYTGKSPL